MVDGIVIAVMAGLGGMLGWGIADFLAKKTIDVIGDISSLAWGHIFGALALLVAFVYQLASGAPVELPTGTMLWVGVILFGVLQAIVYYYVYKGFGKGQVAVLSPVFASFTGITAILSILVYNEVVSPLMLLSLVVLFGGVLLINADASALKSRKFGFVQVAGFKEIAIATILAALWTLYWDRFIGADWITYTFLMYASMTVAIWVGAKLAKVEITRPTGIIWIFALFIGVGEIFAYLALSWGYSVTPHTSIIAVLSGAFSLPVILLSKIFLKEKVTKIQTIGSIIVILGIILISVI